MPTTTRALERERILAAAARLELALFHAHGQLDPAGELGARAALLLEHAVGRGRGGVIGAGGVKKRGGSGEIDFNHVSHPFT